MYDENQELINEPELAGGASNDDVEPSAPGASDSQPTKEVENLSLEELNKFLGKNYPNKDTALKSLKDTFSYVGKKKDTVVKEAFDENKFISREQYEEDMFFSKRQELSNPEIKDVLKSMAKANNVTVQEAAELDSFKKVFGAFKGYSETQNLKSVLETNPRIAQTKSTMQEAREALNSGNKNLAEELATKAVMDAYEM